MAVLRALLALTLSTVVATVVALTPVAAPHGASTLVLLHGLNRTSRSMRDLEFALAARGHRVVNLDYPSAQYPIATLARQLGQRLDACCAEATRTGIDFVTHSLGGILVRELHRQRPELVIRRVVMLGPPNQGTEVVDVMGGSALFRLVTGPAGQELGTGPDSVPNRLGPVRFQLGVIGGTSSLNPIHSSIIPGEDDGTVALTRTRVEGMQDFVAVPANHSLMMHDEEVIRQTVQFIETGRFAR